MIEYREDKRVYSGVQRFIVDLGFSFVRVYVWPHREQLQGNIYTDEDDVVAAYIPVPHRDPCFGELHFVDDEVSLTHIAHELTHLTIDLLDDDQDLTVETIAHIVGNAYHTCMEEIFGLDYL
jgi:hypothetical protein